MVSNKPIIRLGDIQQRILLVRGEKVVLDADLAEFSGVTTKRLNEQVKRNKDRFPKDFVFRLTRAERTEVVAKCDHLSTLKYSSTVPYAFTEHGALMERRLANHDSKILSLFEAIRQLMAPSEVPKKRRIGFQKDGPYQKR